MLNESQHEGPPGLCSETSGVAAIALPLVRRPSAHVQRNIAGGPISTGNRTMESVQSSACSDPGVPTDRFFSVGWKAGNVAANYGLREGEACAGARAYL